ncbi:hypothetical protein [Amycolatopsis sp. SID8362]|uniref:hypothetical protein n=1 Tax=Amycolatopsis sp. SID8362 TaxID=2690346 RepID=UPI001370E294|nr:hypothetical protein [Amycolatopsis sp. SID8362]NBH01834.1 hypothetical protein [Amycolatopsis sp. SID8362]NED38536.1 hypothetical protein [Amycolatopsis sp. SID8362]
MTSTATAPGPTAPAPGPPPPPPESGGRSGLLGLLDLPGQGVRAVVRSAATTPGRLTVIAVGLVLLSLLAGLVATLSVQNRDDTITGVIDHREPLAAAAQQVYRSLSDADATAASAFLSIGTEPPELRQRYERDIAEAGAALAKAASDASDVAAAVAPVDVLNQSLPVYTGLVETARANNRLGYPVGASYLREASELMRAKILPAAQDLYRVDTERLIDEQDGATGFPWLATILVVALLAALIAAQVYLTKRTNRLLNVGLVVATAAVVVSLLWGAVALIVQGSLVGSGQDDGSHRVDVLVRARIAALQARADETLTLVARGDGAAYEKDFGTNAAQLVGPDGQGGLLGEARGLIQDGEGATKVADAAKAANDWLKAHKEVRAQDDAGQYQEAVDFAVLEDKTDGSAPAFRRLDDSLQAAIDVGRQEFLDDTHNGDRALTLLAPGLAVLAVVAAAGVTMGIRERLREYR